MMPSSFERNSLQSLLLIQPIRISSAILLPSATNSIRIALLDHTLPEKKKKTKSAKILVAIIQS